MCVERIAHGVEIPVPGEIDMGDLAARVNAGTGASSALNQSSLACQRFNRGGQHALHSPLIGLNLPPCERSAIVFKRELVARHAQFTRVPVLICIPRRNSSEVMGCLPARWRCESRTAPSPQAMVRLSSSTVP